MVMGSPTATTSPDNGQGSSPPPQEVIDYCESLSENTLEDCSDGEDNDLDGFVDCMDFSCNGQREPFPPQEVIDFCAALVTPENTFELCTDRIDNDGNGFTDCADFSCAQAPEALVRQACQESLFSPTSSTASTANAKCSDGIDNDRDGFIDCADFDCNWDPQVTVCGGPGARTCEPGACELEVVPGQLTPPPGVDPATYQPPYPPLLRCRQ